MDTPESSTPRQKLLLLVLDKLVLALILAVAGYLLSLQLKRDEKTIEYQRSLFDNRRDAYVTLLAVAGRVRDVTLLYYASRDTTVITSSRELAWRVRLGDLSDKHSSVMQKLNPAAGSGFGIASSDEWDFSNVAMLLDTLETVRRDEALYISMGIDAQIDSFMTAVTSDLSSYFSVLERRASTDKARADGSRDVAAAFERLRDAVRASLRVEDIILGR
jgi:hypothetical protein